MRPLKRLIQFEEALTICLTEARGITRTEKVSIEDALGRVSAEKIVSHVSVPPFSRAAMDGYAVRAADTYGAGKLKPLRLRLQEIVYAGSVPRKPVRKGSCTEIATGAMVPRGADAVVMVEDTERQGNSILVYQAVHPGENVSARGEDISPGTEVIAEGELLNPSKIGALAATGTSQVKVYAKPTVAVIPTGDEIAELGGRLKPGQVFNINAYTLSGVVSASGGQARRSRIVSDTVEDLERALHDNSDCDVIVFSGGSSVGERDVMLDVIERNGKVLFHGVAVKPGKPTLFGTVGKSIVFGMPGYPTACLSNAYILLAPVIRRMARLPEGTQRSVIAPMAKRVVSTTGRTQFLTVRLEGGTAHPAFKESGAITSMAFADGYVIIPADVDLVEKDEMVTVHLL